MFGTVALHVRSLIGSNIDQNVLFDFDRVLFIEISKSIPSSNYFKNLCNSQVRIRTETSKSCLIDMWRDAVRHGEKERETGGSYFVSKC